MNVTKRQQSSEQGGYIAIASVLVILAIVLVITLSVSLLAIDGVQISLNSTLNEDSGRLVDSCAQEALLRINKDDALPTSIVLPEITCSVTENSHVGNNWNFSVSGNTGQYGKSITVDAVRNTNVTVTSWQE
jgi:hypothetical protein